MLDDLGPLPSSENQRQHKACHETRIAPHVTPSRWPTAPRSETPAWHLVSEMYAAREMNRECTQHHQRRHEHLSSRGQRDERDTKCHFYCRNRHRDHKRHALATCIASPHRPGHGFLHTGKHEHRTHQCSEQPRHHVPSEGSAVERKIGTDDFAAKEHHRRVSVFT